MIIKLWNDEENRIIPYEINDFNDKELIKRNIYIENNVRIGNDVIIGNDVSIGEGSIICSGTTLMSRTTIGCNMVISSLF